MILVFLMLYFIFYGRISGNSLLPELYQKRSGLIHILILHDVIIYGKLVTGDMIFHVYCYSPYNYILNVAFFLKRISEVLKVNLSKINTNLG